MKPESITLTHIKSCADPAEYEAAWAGQIVNIKTDRGVWRTDGAGYTLHGQPDAWALPFEEALRIIRPLGPEKKARLLRPAREAVMSDRELDAIICVVRGMRMDFKTVLSLMTYATSKGFTAEETQKAMNIIAQRMAEIMPGSEAVETRI